MKPLRRSRWGEKFIIYYGGRNYRGLKEKCLLKGGIISNIGAKKGWGRLHMHLGGRIKKMWGGRTLQFGQEKKIF